MDNSKLEVISDELKKDINKIRDSLTKIDDTIKNIQDGDVNGSYWNGEGAFSSLTSCLNQIDYNRSLLVELEKCSDYLDSLLKK